MTYFLIKCHLVTFFTVHRQQLKVHFVRHHLSQFTVLSLASTLLFLNQSNVETREEMVMEMALDLKDQQKVAFCLRL